MKLTPERIKQFQVIYKKEFGIDISYSAAEQQGLALITLIKYMIKMKK